jgi:hypothetical protein
MTLVMLVGGLLSALGCGVLERAHRPIGQAKVAGQLTGTETRNGATPNEQARHSRPDDKRRPRSATGDARHSASSTNPLAAVSATLRRVVKARSVLLSLLSHALAESAGQANDQFDSGDAHDLVDDDCPHGYAVIAFPALSLPVFVAPDLAPNLWGIQPSIGHPHGDEEPPRV